MDQATVDAIIAAVSFATIIVGIGGLATVLMGFKVVTVGVRRLIGFLR